MKDMPARTARTPRTEIEPTAVSAVGTVAVKPKGPLPPGFARLHAEGKLGGAKPGGGRKPDPRGGRTIPIAAKLNTAEVVAMQAAKRVMERALNRAPGTMPDSEFIRLRLLGGGDPWVVNYPNAPAPGSTP